jgi:acetyltransferase
MKTMESASEHFLEGFLNPDSVAIVGASRNPLRINHYLVANLVKLGYKGRIYPVHPGVPEILGLKTYPSVALIEEVVDLAVVAVPQTATLEVLQDCAAKGVKRVVIVAGGFSETGEGGRNAQNELAHLLRRNGMRAIGPNALSPINTARNFAISFHPLEEIRKGGLSLIFQSGLYEPRLRWLLSEFNLHLNKLIDLGNKMDINEVDALAYLVQDPLTRVIGIHLESVEGDAREFLRLIREAACSKHVVVLKSGRTEAGARAAASHTGVMVQGSDVIFDAALRQAGAIRAQTIEEFFDVARALERFGSIPMPGNQIALATLPGGEGVILTDLSQQEGLSLASVQDETLAALRPIFPPWEISANPFDLGVCLQFNGGRKVYDILLRCMAADPKVDGLAIQMDFFSVRFLPQEAFQVFAEVVEAHRKPIVVWVAGVHPGKFDILQWLEEHQVVVFPGPEKAFKALAALHRSSHFKTIREGPD